MRRAFRVIRPAASAFARATVSLTGTGRNSPFEVASTLIGSRLGLAMMLSVEGGPYPDEVNRSETLCKATPACYERGVGEPRVDPGDRPIVIRTPYHRAEQTPGESSCASGVDLSIIVPACNEEGSVRHLYHAILGPLEAIDRGFEIIFVDDGSTDRTFARCAELAGRDRRVRVIKFRRNYGQTAAMVAGMDHARGRILVTLDADLQNDPADIPVLIEKIDQGYDLVVGWRHERQDKTLSRKLPSMLANWLIGKVTGVPIRDNGCSLKAYRAGLMRRVPLYAEMHRFIPAMASLAGARIAEVKVRHHRRRFGRSKYGLSRTYKVLMDLLAVRTLLAFARRPLFCFIGAASVPGILSVLFFLLCVVYVIGALKTPTVVYAGMAMLFGVLALFLVVIGLIGYLIYHGAVDGENRSLPLLGSTELGALDD